MDYMKKILIIGLIMLFCSCEKETIPTENRKMILNDSINPNVTLYCMIDVDLNPKAFRFHKLY